MAGGNTKAYAARLNPNGQMTRNAKNYLHPVMCYSEQFRPRQSHTLTGQKLPWLAVTICQVTTMIAQPR